MISVIIPVFNEEKHLSSFLECILNFELSVLSECEFIFIDGLSTDNSVGIIENTLISSGLNYRILHNPKRSVPTSLNLAINNSIGDPIIRLDVHTAYPCNYLTLLIEKFYFHDVDNLGGVSLATAAKNSNSISKIFSVILRMPIGVGNSEFRTGVDVAKRTNTVVYGCFKRSIFEKVGLFNEALHRNQDIEYNRRIINSGGVVLTDPEIKSYYHPERNLFSFLNKAYKNGLWNMKLQYLSNVKNVLRFSHFAPLFFVILTLSIIFLLPYAIFLISLFNLYLIFVLYSSRKFNLNHFERIQLPFVLFTFHFAYGIGEMFGTILYLKHLFLNNENRIHR